MADILKIPYLNPLRFHRNDQEWAYELIPDHEVTAQYLQKFKGTDKLMFQAQLLKDNYVSIGYAVLDQYLNELSTYTGILIALDLAGYDVWSTKEDDNILVGLAEGIYFIEIRTTLIIEGQNVEKKFLSEPFKRLADTDAAKDTVVIEYTHDGNDLDMAFIPGPRVQKYFRIRVEGGVNSDGFEPGSKDSFYIDQVHNVVMLDSNTFNVLKFTFGNGRGIPNWMADKLNRILSLSYVEINGRQYVKNDGAKFEAIREKGYPFAGWSIEMVLAEGVNSITEGAGTQQGDYNIDYNEDYY